VARRSAIAVLFGSLSLSACSAPDPRQELEIRDLETYWAVDASVGATQYLAPVVRFRLLNKGQQRLRYVLASAAFRRKGQEAEEWGSASTVVTASKDLEAGRESLVVMESNGRYFSTGTPQSMFEHKLFRDAHVEVFLRIGSSNPTKMGEADVERHIGTKTVQAQAP
jgi:hypothetical protein